MMNIYNGNIILDNNGEAVVTMPDWLDALNQDFRYQLTCIGDFAPVFIASKMNKKSFKIAGGKPGIEISWMVTGIRHDKYAEKNRIQVEVDKNDFEKGYYQHPAAYGLPLNRGISYKMTHKDK